MENKIICPYCMENLIVKKSRKGEITLSIIGSGIGYSLSSGLGLAGAIAGFSIALPATLIGTLLLGVIGNRFGKNFDDKPLKCPKCFKKLNV